MEGRGRREDVALLGELSKNMLGRTFCALGDAAAMPTISIVDKFAEDFEQHIERTTVAVGEQAVMV
jgi:NADH-quinone oxidoreductase subunit F